MGARRRRSHELEEINAKTRRLLAQALSMLREALSEERIPREEAHAVLTSIRQRLGIDPRTDEEPPPLELDAWLEKRGRRSVDRPDAATGTAR